MSALKQLLIEVEDKITEGKTIDQVKTEISAPPELIDQIVQYLNTQYNHD